MKFRYLLLLLVVGALSGCGTLATRGDLFEPAGKPGKYQKMLRDL